MNDLTAEGAAWIRQQGRRMPVWRMAAILGVSETTVTAAQNGERPQPPPPAARKTTTRRRPARAPAASGMTLDGEHEDGWDSVEVSRK